MNSVSVYEYQNPKQFLMDSLVGLQKTDPSVSVRKLAKEMGFKNHTLLVMLLQGQRPIRVRHASHIAKGLKLSSQERLYFQALIQFDQARDPEEKELCSLWLSDLHPQKDFKAKEVDEFILISHWVHMAILAMTCLRDFEGTAEWISKKLNHKVTLLEVRAALERLIQLGLLRQTPEKKLELTYKSVSTKDDISNAGARKYHREVMKLADLSLDEIPLHLREFQSFTIPIKKEKITLAKEMIRNFRSKLVQTLMADQDADEIFQINLQLFQLTDVPGNAMVLAQDEGVESESIHKGETYEN